MSMDDFSTTDVTTTGFSEMTIKPPFNVVALGQHHSRLTGRCGMARRARSLAAWQKMELAPEGCGLHEHDDCGGAISSQRSCLPAEDAPASAFSESDCLISRETKKT